MARARGSASRKSGDPARTTPGVIERLARSLRSRNGGSPLSGALRHRAGTGPYRLRRPKLRCWADRRNASPAKTFRPDRAVHRQGFQRRGAAVAAAFQRLRAMEARLVFAGSENLPVEFQSLGNVEHLGLLDKTDPVQLQRLLTAYRDADVFLLPSRRDPFPTVIREAMFFGLPCVASNIWAMQEMIEDGTTGFLVPMDDPDALFAKTASLLKG